MLETCGISSLAHYGGSGDGYGSLPTDFGVVVVTMLELALIGSPQHEVKVSTAVYTLLIEAQHISNESTLLRVNTPRCDEDSIEHKELMVFMSDASAGFDQTVDFLNAHTINAKRTACNEFSCFIASAVICIATGRKFNFSKYIFDNMVRNVDSPSKFLMYPFLQVVMDNQVDDMTTHNTIYTSPALTHKVFANTRRVRKGVEIPIAPAPPSTTSAPSPPALQDPTPTPYATPPQDQPLTPHDLPPQDQPTTPHESSMPLLTTLLETSEEEGKKVRKEKEVKVFMVKKAEKGWEGKIEAIDADEDITLVDVEINEEVVEMDAESQGRLNQEEVDAASKGVSAVSAPELVSAAEPTIFDDKDVTMSMDQSLIKLKAEKAKLLDEQIAQKLHDEENMAGYKMEFFRGMTYDKVRPIFEREYKKVETLFKLDKDVQEPKKTRVADETLLQESFKKLRATEVSGSESTQEIPSNDLKEISEEDIHNMLEIVPVPPEFKVKALHVKYPIIDWEIHTEGSRVYWKIIRVGGITEAYQVFENMPKGFDREDLVALWNLVKEKFSSPVPSEDKEKALWVELKRLFEPYADDVL
uniref:Synaptobrevin, longin-like domain protein n=1 Tax=Tanacetum cinerariifolium TaxID=118510 RepID=A0A6L2KAL4_TANCI|nr:hypothetical protein [Tanacetum cinerariifolium]